MKVIQLPHKVIDYMCPINGVCDLYEWKTGQRIPDDLLLYISHIGFVYIKHKNAIVPRMVYWGNGIGKRQYDFLGDILAFRSFYTEGTSYTYALKKAKEWVDADTPVILFSLNMYHLPYMKKYYHQVDIPGHIVLMVGYSDEEESVYVHDNSRAEVQSIPYVDLEPAWSQGLPGLSKKNAMFVLQFPEQLPGREDVIRHGLAKRVEAVLFPPIKNLGISGIRKLASQFPQWSEDLGNKGLIKAYTHFVTYTGSVIPALPQRMGGPKMVNPHRGARDSFAGTLLKYRKRFGNASWDQAAGLFEKSGAIIADINDIVTNYLTGIKADIDKIPSFLSNIADIEEEAFALLSNGVYYV